MTAKSAIGPKGLNVDDTIQKNLSQIIRLTSSLTLHPVAINSVHVGI